MTRYRCEGIVPAHWYVAVGKYVVRHRVREAANHFKFVVSPTAEFRNTVSGEKLRRTSICSCLPCHSLAAILAVFERGCVFRVGPSAAGTVEPTRLIHVRQGGHT